MKNNLKPILFAVVLSILLLFGVLAGKRFLTLKENQNNGNPPITDIFISPTIALPPDIDQDNTVKEFNNAEKVPYTYTLSTGEEFTINIPKGMDPPPQEVVEKLKKLQDSGK